MAIDGLTNQFNAKMETGPRGRNIRIGWLQKGRREGYGKNIKLYDDDYFNFRAADANGIGERLEQLFREVYGNKPMAINDVRIPHTVAGNFNIENCAWLVCSKHTEKGSMFIGQSDGKHISRLRDEETGKVVRFDETEMGHTAVSIDDGSKYGAIKYREKVYPWQQSMAIDLILTDLNEAMFNEQLSGLGVVTLLTHSTYDIASLIAEYYGMINEVVSLMANPLDQGSVERAGRYVPLRNIPMRLYRSEDAVTTPNWKTQDAGDRMNGTRSLLHWQLAPDFSLAVQEAMRKRTDIMLNTVANMPLLQAGRPFSGKEVDDMFSYHDAEALPEPKQASYDGPDWEEFDNAPEDIDFEDSQQPEHEPDFWLNQALGSKDLDGLAMALFKLHEQSGVVGNAQEMKGTIIRICGKSPDSGCAVAAIGKYINAVADGTAKATAVKAAEGCYLKEAA